ncbi:MAG: ABC-type multidrug transport system [Candidatus Alkanophagales archaeon MCA70_species_2]|nr:ABC-type multidrug transport system [Candidatus Alkanophaga liquidiphilum]
MAQAAVMRARSSDNVGKRTQVKMKVRVLNPAAIYTLWLRETIRFFRLRSRVLGSLGMPLFFLAFLAFLPVEASSVHGLRYIDFLAPGIVGMTLLFSSMFAGLSVLWDKEFGFLREIMVAPVSRVSIILGRIAGGMTTSLFQGVLMLLAAFPMGFRVEGLNEAASPAVAVLGGVLLAVFFMMLISVTFIGMGVALASKLKDMSGYSLVMNFLVFPIFFLSGALFPLDGFPHWVRTLAYADPLTYGVDALRKCLVGVGEFPLLLDFAALVLSSIAMVWLGAYLFEKTEV